MSNENKTTGINWSKVMVRNAHGAADPVATLVKLETELAEHIGQTEISPDLVSEAVASAFAKMPAATNKTLDMGTLAMRAIAELNATGIVESKVAERVKAYVRGESDLFKKTLGAEGLYVIRTGRDQGGVAVSTPDVVKRYRETQAAKAAAEAK